MIQETPGREFSILSRPGLETGEDEEEVYAATFLPFEKMWRQFLPCKWS